MKPAAITAELVDVRNVGLHKCIKLTLHVPAEKAADVVAAFGWPTQVDPVPVALARLLKQESEDRLPVCDAVSAPSATATINPARALTRKAAIMCKDKRFQVWLQETNSAWRIMNLGSDEEKAAAIVRAHCGVKSRTEIIPGTPAGQKWDAMYSEFSVWRDVPELAVS